MSLIGAIRDAITGLTAAVTARSQTPAGNVLQVQIGPGDPISNIPVLIDYPHHQVHEGEAFQFTYSPAALANGNNLDFRIVVGAVTATTRVPHLVVEADCTAETWIHLYEAPTTSGNGTQKTAYNRNRGSAATPNATIWEAPVTAAGTELNAAIVGSGNKVGGSDRASAEWPLAPSTVYLVRLTAKATGDIVCVRLQFYEDTGA
jgi:hypothetical protein